MTMMVCAVGAGTSIPLAVSASDVSGSAANTTGSALVTSSTPGTTASGGYSPYTYAWTYVSGDAGIACSNSTAQSPSFSKTLSAGPGGSTDTNAVWRCTVTDSASQTAHADINIHLHYDNNHA